MAKQERRSQPPMQAKRRAWPWLVAAFTAVVFGSLAMDGDYVDAQPVQKKAKTTASKSDYNPKARAPLPVAQSLTNGKKIDAALLAKLIDQEINKRIQAEGAKSTGLCDDSEFVRRVYLDLTGVI